MAQIPVERKGTPWWIWALLLLVGVVALWAVLRGRDSEVASLPPAELATGADRAETGEIVVLHTVWDAEDAESLVGRSVRISDARVLSVTGDKTFWVGDSAEQQVLVVLDEQPTPNQPTTEGRYDVNPGQVVTIYGSVQRFPGFEEARQRWNVSPALRDEFEKQRVYLHADRLEITHRP